MPEVDIEKGGIESPISIWRSIKQHTKKIASTANIFTLSAVGLSASGLSRTSTRASKLAKEDPTTSHALTIFDNNSKAYSNTLSLFSQCATLSSISTEKSTSTVSVDPSQPKNTAVAIAANDKISNQLGCSFVSLKSKYLNRNFLILAM